MPQYTIRNIPEALDRELRERAKRLGMSLNETAIEVLKNGLGLSGNPVEYDNLDDLAGTWKNDEVFDRVMIDQDKVDPDLWR